MTPAIGLRPLRLACIDSEAPPLFHRTPDGRTRTGYEPDAASLVAGRLGRDVEWVFLPWDQLLVAVTDGRADAVWCGQGVTPERAAQVDFTRPYAVFGETLVVRSGDPARAPEDLAGYRIGAIEGSINEKLARTFPGIELVGFGSSDDVFGDMIAATRDGTIDGFVDDDVVNVPLVEDDPDLIQAFDGGTRNPWAAGVRPGDDELRLAIDGALDATIADGSLAEAWTRWMPSLPFPLVPAR
ncbi:ABC transporter substrate-binding protein [Pseudonocardia endophytica]|uniref:Amino acid ABC transporter substrate-binding protein (PAAT family) n=1 Tax=Pseudonocardia endophytica TaxID=401976 RepID=A0A4R1HKP4_PSEEN|nr:ABC transporter substrate-binding protein [Pseudonocardia endophytica]TCK21075.1 amino acid ABC transporter substrate-binding protein (PAAT family) [Pseudonocardia endophytica]